MLISEEYSGIYVKEQLFYLLLLVEIYNAFKNLLTGSFQGTAINI